MAGDDKQVRKLRQGIDQIIGEAIAEILLSWNRHSD